MSDGPTKILIVDDSALYRQSIQNVLRDDSNVTIVGVAENGLEALRKIEELDPDLLTLDVQMPDMDGIELLRAMNRSKLRPKAIMVSSLTSEGAKVTTAALMEGAFDFVLKPSGAHSSENRQQLRDALREKIQAFRDTARRRRRRRQALSDSSPSLLSKDDNSEPSKVANACQAVVLGASTGGPVALKHVLGRVSADFDVPLIVAQHMPVQYTASLASRLNELCPLPVVEASDGMEAKDGQVVIAAGGRQLQVEKREGSLFLHVVDDPPENGVRPSIDYLLRSAIPACDANILAVIMTGMGKDGMAGCQMLKDAGGYVFAQHQDDCTVYGMPRAVIESNLVDRVLPLGKIAPAIARHVRRSRRV